MKILSTLTFFSALLLFSSCSKEEFSESIIGSWKLKSFEVSADCEDVEFENATIENGCLVIAGGSSCISIVFMENGAAQGTITNNGETEVTDLNYTVNDDTEMITLCDGGPDCNTIERDGDDIRFIVEDDGCEIVYIFEKE